MSRAFWLQLGRDFDPALDTRPKPLVMCTAEENKTRTDEAAATDINRIVNQYAQTGVLPQVAGGRFIDVTELPDYRTALHQVMLAEEVFMALPAQERLRFDNDAATFLDFAADPANRAELVRLKVLPSDGSETLGEVVSTTGAPASPPIGGGDATGTSQ